MNEFWDRLGISTSLICIVHCLFSPILVFLTPLGGEFFSEQWFHWLVGLIVIPVAVGALWYGYRRHGKISVLALGGVGVLLFAIGLTLAEVASTTQAATDPHQDPISVIAMVIAGITLSAAHLLNLRGCRHHPHRSTPSPQ